MDQERWKVQSKLVFYSAKKGHFKFNLFCIVSSNYVGLGIALRKKIFVHISNCCCQ